MQHGALTLYGRASMQLLPIVLFAFSLCHSVPTDAGSSSERDALLAIDRHLDRLHVLITAAEKNADPDVRIRLRYDWLRQDVALVRSGVLAHANDSSTEKRARTALRGDYRR